MRGSIKTLGVLNIVQGVCELFVALAFGASAAAQAAENSGVRGSADLPLEFLVLAALVCLVIGALHIAVGVQHLKYRGRTFGIVVAVLSLATCITGSCCCTGIPLSVFALIVYFNSEASETFARVGRGEVDLDTLAVELETEQTAKLIARPADPYAVKRGREKLEKAVFDALLGIAPPLWNEFSLHVAPAWDTAGRTAGLVIEPPPGATEEREPTHEVYAAIGELLSGFGPHEHFESAVFELVRRDGVWRTEAHYTGQTDVTALNPGSGQNEDMSQGDDWGEHDGGDDPGGAVD